MKKQINESMFGGGSYRRSYNRYYGDAADRYATKKTSVPKTIYLYEIGYYTAKLTDNFSSEWSKENTSKLILAEIDKDKMREEDLENLFTSTEMRYGHVSSSYGKEKQRMAWEKEYARRQRRIDGLKEDGQKYVDVAREYWSANAQDSSFVKDIKENISKESVDRFKAGMMMWAIWKANKSNTVVNTSENESENESKDTTMESVNKFDKTYNMIMESLFINGNEQDNVGKVRWLFKKYLKVMPPEVQDEVIKKAIDMSRNYFKKAMENDWTLNGVIFNNVGVRNNMKVSSVEGDDVTYTAENPNSFGGPITTTAKIGTILSSKSVQFIKDSATPYFEKEMNDRREIQRQEAQAQAEQHKADEATYNTPEYKAFNEELRKTFPTAVGTFVSSNPRRMVNGFLDFIKSQPDEIRQGFINKLKHTSFRDPYIQYADGGAYYQQQHEDDYKEAGRFELIEKIKNL